MKCSLKIEIGDKINCLTILGLDDSKSFGNKKHFYYLCRCDCGQECSLRSDRIRNYHKKCKHKNHEDLFGKIIGHIKVLSETYTENIKGKNVKLFKYECLKCGMIKSSPGYALKIGNITTCYSEKCRPKGKEHGSYKIDADHESRKASETKVWSREVMKKCNFKCVICSTNKKLQSHHLDGWNWCVNKRFDINNGVCMCLDCHNKFHKIYGKGNNTKSQFLEFQEIYRLH